MLAIATSVRRASAPRSAPSATAKTAKATGTTSRWSKLSHRALLTRSSGRCHHVTAVLSNPTSTAVTSVTSASRVAIQRVLVTLWVQASR